VEVDAHHDVMSPLSSQVFTPTLNIVVGSENRTKRTTPIPTFMVFGDSNKRQGA